MIQRQKYSLCLSNDTWEVKQTTLQLQTLEWWYSHDQWNIHEHTWFHFEQHFPQATKVGEMKALTILKRLLSFVSWNVEIDVNVRSMQILNRNILNLSSFLCEEQERSKQFQSHFVKIHPSHSIPRLFKHVKCTKNSQLLFEQLF